jgi:hypothetical protein
MVVRFHYNQQQSHSPHPNKSLRRSVMPICGCGVQDLSWLISDQWSLSYKSHSKSLTRSFEDVIGGGNLVAARRNKVIVIRIGGLLGSLIEFDLRR